MKNFCSLNLKKILATILGFFGIGALTACYGMPPNEDLVVYGHVSGVTDENGEATKLNNIKVFSKNLTGDTRTDSNGYYQLNFPYSDTFTLFFQDDYNNEYVTDSVQINFDSTDVVVYDIVLKKKEKGNN